VRIVINEADNHLSEKIEVKDGNNWISILSSNPGFSTLNFWSRNHVYSKPYSYRKRTKKKLYYDLKDKDFTLNLDYCLEENNILHIRYKLSNNRKLYLSKILLSYAILLGSDPDYTWVPHLRPKENMVMGDHIYRSPVIIYKKGSFSFAFIPDLKTLDQNRPFQSFLDFNLHPKNFRSSAQLAYGFGNYKHHGHVLFKHNPLKKLKIKANTDLTFRYYIIIFKDKEPKDILEFVNDFLWQKYGTKLLHNNLTPQILPYDKNAEEGFKAVIERHKMWGDFILNGEECGGSWQYSWIGKRKKDIRFFNTETFSLEKQMKQNLTQLVNKETLLSKIILYFSTEPFWLKLFERFTRTFPVINRNAEIWYNAWFNNMRTGYGFRYFGDLWSDKDLIDKGDRILNTFLNIPRIRGVSPSVILPESLGKTKISTIKGMQGFFYVDKYSIVDCTLSAYWSIKFIRDFDKEDDLINNIAKELMLLLSEIQYEGGEIPAYLIFESDGKSPIVSDILKGSASSGAPLMFLTEYYKLSKDEIIIPIAEKIANYIETNIIPEDKWHDFEPFYSCTHLPTDFYDFYTKKHVMNGLCIYWNAEGLKELYKITKNDAYLYLGERVLAILSLFQQVWNAPYISYNTYGGFCSQNIDAELSDARQALFVRVYMEYYLLTGKKEYMERGIAALRASWAMQLLKEYEDEFPGNIKNLKTVEGIDRGIVFENYGHSGNDIRVPGYWMPDWGFGTSLMATAYTKKHFGDLFLDFKERMVWGIDGILINSYEFEDKTINIEMEVTPNKNYILIKGRNVPVSPNEIIINGNSLGKKYKEDIEKGFNVDYEG